jgi:hypothetical protein
MIIWAVGRSALHFFFLFVMILVLVFRCFRVFFFFHGIALCFFGDVGVIFTYKAYQTRLFDVDREHTLFFSVLCIYMYISATGNASIAMDAAQISPLSCFRV